MKDRRMEFATQKKAELEEKLEKVKGTPKEREFALQIEKLNEFIAFLQEDN